MITKLKLKNWRSHLDTEIEFAEGTNCFVGNIGSGKTSIMDAICFGLFGTFLQLQQKKIKLEDIIMKKPAAQEKTEVIVSFDIGDESEWTVKRTIAKGKSSAELRKNGELIEGPQSTKVTEEVEKLLKMNYDLFSRAVYSEQNQLDMFLTIPKGQRMKKIDELLAIDKFERARSSTRALVNKFSTVLNEKELMVQNLRSDDSLQKLEASKRDFLEFKNKEDRMNGQLSEVFNKKIGMAKEILNLKQQQKKLREIEEDSRKITALIELMESDIEKIKGELVEFSEKTDDDLKVEIKNNEIEIEGLNTSLNDEKKNLDEMKDKFAEDNAQINILEKEKIPSAEKLVKELDEITDMIKKNPIKKLIADLEDSKKELEKNQLGLQKSLARLSEIEDSINELGLVGSTCPVCDSKLTENKKTKLIEKKKDIRKDLKKDIEKCTSVIEKMQSELPALEKKIREIEKMQERLEVIKDCKKELKALETNLKDLKSKNLVFENQKKMFEKNIGLIEGNINKIREAQEKLKLILSKKEEANVKLDRVKEYKQQLNALGSEKELLVSFSPFVLEKLETDYQTIIGLEGELQANLRNLTEIKNEKQKLLEEMESKKTLLENYELEIRTINAVSDQLRLLESALEATQEQLRKDFVTAVNEAMQFIWVELYPYKDIYSIRLGIEEGDYVLQLEDSTGWIPADGVASGGERSIACLALRIAFSLVLAPQLRMLVLDEPTANLDVQSIEVLADVLRDRITKLVDQCFLVTHDEKLKEAVSGFCYEFSRDKSKDEVTSVVLVSSPTQV
jgi:exonuclease SbcC